jgi:hypothetical protein
VSTNVLTPAICFFAGQERAVRAETKPAGNLKSTRDLGVSPVVSSCSDESRMS